MLYFYEHANNEINTLSDTISLHDALPISSSARFSAGKGSQQEGNSAERGLFFGGDAVEFGAARPRRGALELAAGGHDVAAARGADGGGDPGLENQIAERAHPLRSEEHTSELQSLMRISYAVFCLKNTKPNIQHH